MLIAAISEEGMGATMMSVEGPLIVRPSKTYVKHFVVPTFKEGQVVLMDNLQVHKSSRVRKFLENVGASVLFLAPY